MAIFSLGSMTRCSSSSVSSELFRSASSLSQLSQPPQTLGTPLATFREKTAYGATIKIGFYFLTYEWSRRRLSLIKMINGAEVALILLFTAFRYEYLFEVPSYAFE